MKYPKNWEKKENYLERVFEFDNFVQAVEFVNDIVPLAEEQGHHPDIEIFSYNKVRVKLTTHDEGSKITEKDVRLARKIEAILS
jgi:4a-hydroxytetrahydrobiopterin dehydratase